MKLPTQLFCLFFFLLIGHLAHGQLYKTPLLESLPTSPYVIYLDFDGQNVKSPYWNGGIRIEALPSNATENDIRLTWLVVSEDYSPFNINVTTDSTVFHRAAMGKRVRCIFTPTGGWINIFTAAGVANQSSFTIATEDVPCWAFNAVGRAAGEVASHEIGHTLGLSHDGRQIPGQALEPYFPGQNKWGAIMSGSFSTSMITQWSKGEYNYATNTEDDLAIISSAFNGFGYRTDEAGNTIATAKDLGYNTNGTIDKLNDGIITDRNDVDMYRFTTTGGKIMINAEGPPIVIVQLNDSARISDLNIAMKLMDQNGNVLINSDSPAKMSASINTVLAAGTYYLSIDGVGNLDPAVDGYSDYGSIGQYFLSGTIPVGTNQAPVVRISFPANYSSYAAFMLSPYADVFDMDGTAGRVDFYNYDTLLVSTQYPFSQLDWNYTTPGTYKITAKAYDNLGAVTESTPIYLEYVLPEVNLIAPVTQSTYQEGATISMSATARIHSKYAISNVQFYDGTTLLFTDNTAPYSYSWTNVPAGVHTIYAKAQSNVSSANAKSSGAVVTVQPVAPTSFTTSTDTPCAGATGVIYTFANVAFGYRYEWEYSGTGFTITSGNGTNSITVDFDPTATSGTLSVKSVSNTVRSAALSKAITVSPLPITPGSITGNTSPIAGTTSNAYSITPVSNTTYQWSYNRTDATLTANGASVTINFSSAALPGILSVIAHNGCGNSAASTLPINVIPPPPAMPTAFTSSTSSVCAGALSITYTVPSVSGVTYLWEYSGSGFTISHGDGTNSITADFSPSSTSGTLSVKAQSNGQASSPLTMTITISTVPSSPGSITGNNSPVAGTTSNAYNVAAINNITYQWSYSRTDATLTQNGANVSLDFSSTAEPGILSVTARNSCGISVASTLSIGVTPVLPVAPATPTAFTTSTSSLCAGTSSVRYTIPAVSGVTYVWEYSGFGFTIVNGNGTNSITANFNSTATSGTLTVKAVSNGLNSSPLTISITVSPLPSSPGIITGNISPGAGTSGNVYSISSVSNTTYLWSYSNNDAALTPTGASATLDFSSTAIPGTLSVAAKNSCGTSAASTLLINVVPKLITGIEPGLTSFSVYPSPSTGVFTLNAPSVANSSMITITDLFGRIIYESAVETEKVIDLTYAAKGMYVLRVEGSDHTFLTKITLN